MCYISLSVSAIPSGSTSKNPWLKGDSKPPANNSSSMERKIMRLYISPSIHSGPLYTSYNGPLLLSIVIVLLHNILLHPIALLGPVTEAGYPQ